MADKFDPYREALIVETKTIWSADYDYLESVERARLEETLHSDPENCSDMEYVRVTTGFCRQITVTPDDLERLEA